MENRDFKRYIDINRIVTKFLNLLNFIILKKVNQKIKIFELLYKIIKIMILITPKKRF